MPNILSTIKANEADRDIRSALREIGCDLSHVDDLGDVAKAIRHQCVTGPNAVINASLKSGSGIKITPIDRQGYKVSANAEATLTNDLNEDIQAGTSVQKALYSIVNNIIPKAQKEVLEVPFILDYETIKTDRCGQDDYDNKAFGCKGRGTKRGLRPFEWYIKVYTYASVEPLYIPLQPALDDLKEDILSSIQYECKQEKPVKKLATCAPIKEVIKEKSGYECGVCKPTTTPKPKKKYVTPTCAPTQSPRCSGHDYICPICKEEPKENEEHVCKVDQDLLNYIKNL